MFLTSASMVTTLVVISMLQPVAHHSILIPALLGKVLALKYALIVVPKIAIGAVLFGEGAALIGGHLLWNYLEWKRRHPHYRHRPFRYGWVWGGGWGGAPPKVHHGWGGHGHGHNNWQPWLHSRYNAAYHKGHRAVDYLAWGLDKAQWGLQVVGSTVGEKAAKALLVASELAKPSHVGWPSPPPPLPPLYAPHHHHDHGVVTVDHGPPIIKHIGGHGHTGHYHHHEIDHHHEIQPFKTLNVEVEHGHVTPLSYHGSHDGIAHFGDDLGSSHSHGGPVETIEIEHAGEPGPGPPYDSGSSSYSHGDDSDDGSHVYSSAAAPPSSFGHYHSSTSSPHSDIGPEYEIAGSSRVPSSAYKPEPLDPEEFLKLMDWAGGSGGGGKGSSASGEEYNPDDEQEGQGSYQQQQSSYRFITQPLDPENVHPPRTIRIKRKAAIDQSASMTDKSKATINKKDENFIINLVDDVRRFFTIVDYLDENKCLQKLVCDVHSRARAIKPEEDSQLSVYETHIITAFKILETFMPPYQVDSSTNYRVAARLGVNSPTQDFCSTYFESCTYSAADIIGFSNKIESNQLEKISTTTTRTDESLTQQTQGEASTVVPAGAPSPGAAVAAAEAKMDKV